MHVPSVVTAPATNIDAASDSRHSGAVNTSRYHFKLAGPSRPTTSVPQMLHKTRYSVGITINASVTDERTHSVARNPAGRNSTIGATGRGFICLRLRTPSFRACGVTVVDTTPVQGSRRRRGLAPILYQEVQARGARRTVPSQARERD